MISAITGELRRGGEDRAGLEGGAGLGGDLMTGSEGAELEGGGGGGGGLFMGFFFWGGVVGGGNGVWGGGGRVGMDFEGVFEGGGGGAGGNIEPRLVGFLRADDRAFFNLFITVKGIGPKKALRALVLPTGDIAQAIESRD